MGELYRIANRVRILVWPNDHTPAHVHVLVRAEGIEFRVFLETLEIDYITTQQLSASDEKMILEFIANRRVRIQEKWDEIQRDQ
jgi:hypothetical protein